MNSLKSISRRNVLHEVITRLQSTAAQSSESGSSSSRPEFVIPRRIERGPTDILKALESTVTRDPTAPRYKFLDDPYLIPTSNTQMRSYALSRESGKKTAMWLHREHGDLFPKGVAVPEIKAFKPPTIYTDKSTASEEALMEEISMENVPDAIQIYQLLEGNVSVAAKQSLLELLCFTNSESQLSQNLLETRWYIRKEREKNVWRACPEVAQLFEFLKTQDSATAAAAYNSMICGMAKHLNAGEAWKLYRECQEARIPVTVHTYNYLFKIVPALAADSTKLTEIAKELCMRMSAEGIQPTINTLNAALKTILKIKQFETAQELFRIFFAEFKRLNIEPSLASYHHAILLYSRDGAASRDVFMDVLHKLEGKQFVMRDRDDVLFFPTAMEIATDVYGDRDAAEALHVLLTTGNNYRFLGDNYSESCYFRSYLKVVLNTETFQDFMKVYDKLVPNVYVPELDLMSQILDSLKSNSQEVILEHLPRFWSQALMFSLTDRLSKKLLNMMRLNCPRSDESDYQKQFAEAAWTVWTSITEQEEKRFQALTAHAEMLGNILVLLLRGDQPDQFFEVLTFMRERRNCVIGVLKTDQVAEVFDTCIAQAYVTEVIEFIEYIESAGFDDVLERARTVYRTLELNDSERKSLTDLFGAEILELEAETNN